MEIKSQIKAIVWKIVKKSGDTVKIDDEIILLESMKMETEIQSAVSGKVERILVQDGDAVDMDHPLVLLV